MIRVTRSADSRYIPAPVPPPPSRGRVHFCARLSLSGPALLTLVSSTSSRESRAGRRRVGPKVDGRGHIRYGTLHTVNGKAYTHKLGSRGVENMVGEAGGGWRPWGRVRRWGAAPGGGGGGDLYRRRAHWRPALALAVVAKL